VENQRLQHDAAAAMAQAILDLVENCIREDERHDAFYEFVSVCRAGIETYDVMRDRMQHRLNPLNN
jgi:hypothetical protein